MQRYRESHDFYHLLCSMPVSTLGETVVKIFEASHFGLPVAYLSSLAGPLRLSSEERWLLIRELGPWAWEMGKTCREKLNGGTLLSLYWEERWEVDMREMKRELGLSEPPVRVEYEVKRGMGGKKKKAWTTKTVERKRTADASSASGAPAS
jgi:ubiquinone biosynthesis protein COQ4